MGRFLERGTGPFFVVESPGPRWGVSGTRKRDSHHWEPRSPETTDTGPPSRGGFGVVRAGALTGRTRTLNDGGYSPELRFGLEEIGSAGRPWHPPSSGMSISRRELIRRASALSVSAAVGCADDAGSESGGTTGTGRGSTGVEDPSSTGQVVSTSAADASSSSGFDDGLPQYEYEGEPGPETLFSHGLASGDPLLDSVILWTRLSPETDSVVEAFFEVALDPEFEMRVAADYIDSNPDRDQTIKLDVEGLAPRTTTDSSRWAERPRSVAPDRHPTDRSIASASPSARALAWRTATSTRTAALPNEPTWTWSSI